jgi:hypothetical protein
MLLGGDALYAHAKGGCYRCGRGDRLVDMDAQIVGEGALVICTPCIGEAAEVANLHLNGAAVAEQEAAFQEERRQFAPERVAELEAELAEAREALTHEQVTVANLQDALSRVGRERKDAK